jgi:hypothetical protein
MKRNSVDFISAGSRPASMFSRHFLFILILFGAAVVPYLANSIHGKENAGGSAASGSANAAPPPPGSPSAARQPAVAAKPLRTNQPLDGGPVQELEEVLRFDISPAWVTQRWPRVSTTVSTSEPVMQGYRVPVVTGTRPDDIAGSLTYYFTGQQHVRRIAFQGTTGDPRRLIALVTTKYELRQQSPSAAGELLYQVRWNGVPQSELRCQPDHVIRADAPYGRYNVTLEINNFAAK